VPELYPNARRFSFPNSGGVSVSPHTLGRTSSATLRPHPIGSTLRQCSSETRALSSYPRPRAYLYFTDQRLSYNVKGVSKRLATRTRFSRSISRGCRRGLSLRNTHSHHPQTRRIVCPSFFILRTSSARPHDGNREPPVIPGLTGQSQAQ